MKTSPIPIVEKCRRRRVNNLLLSCDIAVSVDGAVEAILLRHTVLLACRSMLIQNEPHPAPHTVRTSGTSYSEYMCAP